MNPEPILNLRGERVGLGPVSPALIEPFTRWMNDFEVTSTLDLGNLPVSVEVEGLWLKKALQGSPTERIFAIYELKGLTPIGGTGLHQIDFRNGRAILGLFIGAKEHWGKGFATEATRLLLKYAFHNLGLHSVMLEVYDNNPRAVRVYERAGFKLIGRRRQARRVGQGFVDELLYDCVASDLQR